MILLFDWEAVLVHGPLMERWAAAAAIRLSGSRTDLLEALQGIDRVALRAGQTSLEELAGVFGEALDREVQPEEVAASLRDLVVFDIEGLTALARYADRSAVVGSSLPAVPEYLREVLGGMIPPERHLYAHEAGHLSSAAEFFPTVAEALQVERSELVLVTRREDVLEAAHSSGCSIIQWEGSDTSWALVEEADAAEAEEATKVLPDTGEDGGGEAAEG